MTETTPSQATDPAVTSEPTAESTAEDRTVAENQNATQAEERAQTADAEARGEPVAERPTDTEDQHQMYGMSLGRGVREIAGGGNIQEHTLEATPPERMDPLWKQRRYMKSRLAQEAGTIIARAPENIGLYGKGETYRGNGGILVDIDTMEKHRFPDGFKFDTDAVYANSRDLPHVLVEGDVSRNLSGEPAPSGR